MGAIQGSINNAISTATAAIGLAEHTKQQKISNEIAETQAHIQTTEAETQAAKAEAELKRVEDKTGIKDVDRTSGDYYDLQKGEFRPKSELPEGAYQINMKKVKESGMSLQDAEFSRKIAKLTATGAKDVATARANIERLTKRGSK